MKDKDCPGVRGAFTQQASLSCIHLGGHPPSLRVPREAEAARGRVCEPPSWPHVTPSFVQKEQGAPPGSQELRSF